MRESFGSSCVHFATVKEALIPPRTHTCTHTYTHTHAHVCTHTNRFGFITFEDVSTAKQVMKKNDGMDVDGEYISLRFAEERGRGGGRGGGSPGFGRGRGRGGRGGRGNDVIIASSMDPTCSIVAERES